MLSLHRWIGKADDVCLLQIYLMLSCCPCEGRISGIVDAPNACCTLAIPTAIFDQVTSLRCSHSIAFPVQDARTGGCLDSTVSHELECVCLLLGQ